MRKTICQGYFWPQLERHTTTYTRNYDKCQRFAPVSYLSPTEMVLMTSPWPFVQWGVDTLRPLPQAPLQRKFLIVAIDYFIKWIEVEHLIKISKRNTKNFI